MTRHREELGPIVDRIEPRRQGAYRHYGAHPYFTRRPWNVVQAYIKHFSRPGDTVLDPFGGSGVTAVEALFLQRKAIHVDVNPLANFITRQIAVSPVSLWQLSEAFARVKENCRPSVLQWRKEPDAFFEKRDPPFWTPSDAKLPRNADVPLVKDLFTRRQLFALALILEQVNRVPDPVHRDLLRFCFSATLAKANRTFISAHNRAASRGGPTILSVYRYNVPKNPVELDPWTQFEERFENLLRCKKETNKGIGEFYSESHCRILHASATNLRRVIEDASVNYIFTDPPYGAHIAYLDLSVMWNAWLGLPVTAANREEEVIEGGDLDHSRDHYLTLLRESILEMARVLKPEGWLSMVFEHRDGALYSQILSAAEEAGLHYVNTVSQSASVVWSMHKKKNPKRVLSGELIINFCKARRFAATRRNDSARSVASVLAEVASHETAKRGGARTEDVFNHVMVKLLDGNLLGAAPLSLDDLLHFLVAEGYVFDKVTGRWKRACPAEKTLTATLF